MTGGKNALLSALALMSEFCNTLQLCRLPVNLLQG